VRVRPREVRAVRRVRGGCERTRLLPVAIAVADYGPYHLPTLLPGSGLPVIRSPLASCCAMLRDVAQCWDGSTLAAHASSSLRPPQAPSVIYLACSSRGPRKRRRKGGKQNMPRHLADWRGQPANPSLDTKSCIGGISTSKGLATETRALEGLVRWPYPLR